MEVGEFKAAIVILLPNSKIARIWICLSFFHSFLSLSLFLFLPFTKHADSRMDIRPHPPGSNIDFSDQIQFLRIFIQIIHEQLNPTNFSSANSISNPSPNRCSLGFLCNVAFSHSLPLLILFTLTKKQIATSTTIFVHL